MDTVRDAQWSFLDVLRSQVEADPYQTTRELAVTFKIVCALIVALVDFIIIWKIYQLRGISGLATRNAFTLTQRAVKWLTVTPWNTLPRGHRVWERAVQQRRINGREVKKVQNTLSTCFEHQNRMAGENGTAAAITPYLLHSNNSKKWTKLDSHSQTRYEKQIGFFVKFKVENLILTAKKVHRNHGRISNEIRLALNFLLLSVCFLAMTICFNIPLKNGILRELLTKLTCNLNSAKWAIYALGSPTIRSGVLRFLKCRRNDPTNATTSIMGRHTKT
ncbi:unnamed protein product [Haemonchus placei]|uniref:G_PROTEIN_RECEP_F1_2 domain-containing protein n=1 Tax=Haemonchus placei TaxID=6290 RepID=A0A0N4WRA6_HAEPC|nr:unnamed protein product [Haemonchus placei]